MDDDHTREALDALGDLFLTGVEPPPPPPPSLARRRKPRDPKADEHLEGPDPIRLAPRVEVVASGSQQSPDPDGAMSLAQIPAPPSGQATLGSSARLEAQRVLGRDGTAHAGGDAAVASRPGQPPGSEAPFLRLRHEETEPPAAGSPAEAASVAEAWTMGPPQASSTLVEAVLLGNLPGVGGPWLVQYAQLLAQRDGPVAIVHVAADRIDLELVEPRDAPPCVAGPSRRLQSVGGSPGLLGLIEALVRGKAMPVRTILVHLDPTGEPLADARLLALDDWTLLCGADDAALVSAYRMIKQLIESDAAAAKKRIGLMIMGSDPATSRVAAARLQSASASFLQAPVELVGSQQRMAPVAAWQLGTFEAVHELWPRLCEWFATIESPRSEPGESQPVEDPLELNRASEAGPAGPLVEPAPPGPEAIVSPAEPPSPAAPPRPLPAQAGPGPTEPPGDRSGTDPDLGHILATGPGAIRGGVALEARCPFQPQTQLIIDGDGRLHLLCRCKLGEPQLVAVEAMHDVVVDLLEARKWAREHIALLGLTQRECRFDTAAEPVLHLFTDRGDLATNLVARLGHLLKLHLLQDFEVGGELVWHCAPLS